MAEIEVVPFARRPDAKTLTERSAFVVTGYPTQTNDALLEYAAELTTGLADVRAAFPDRVPTVHPVEELARPMLDPFHNVMLSTTSDFFPLHSDEYFAEHPSRFVLLLCLTPADFGGTTLAAYVDDIVSGLNSHDRLALMSPIYPTQIGPKPILEETAAGWNIRFNELEVGRAKTMTGQPLPDDAKAAIAALRLAADRSTRRYDLKAGDCLVICNQRTLHGRTSFHGRAHRLMKRVRIK